MVTRAPATLDRDGIFGILSRVMDPEVPVVSIVELGIVRDVAIEGDAVIVTVTPTYSGCPAMRVIERDIIEALSAEGIKKVEVRTSYSPAFMFAWSAAYARAAFMPPSSSTMPSSLACLARKMRPRATSSMSLILPLRVVMMRWVNWS